MLYGRETNIAAKQLGTLADLKLKDADAAAVKDRFYVLRRGHLRSLRSARPH